MPKPPPTSPPRSLRDHVQHSLPLYTGPYPVGFLEIELPARDPRPFSPHIKRNNEFALKLDTVLFAVYYPAEVRQHSNSPRIQSFKDRHRTDPGGGKQRDGASVLTPTRRRQLSRVPWLPRPRASTCKGYARFLSAPRWPVTAYVAVTSMFTKLPAYRNAKLSSRWPDTAEADPHGTIVSSYESGETLNPTKIWKTRSKMNKEKLRKEEGEKRRRRSEPPRFPVVIFSHGLGGSRTLYSSICGELASFGLIVVAMEHRDGSGARTFVNRSGKGEDLESQGLDKTAGLPENEKKPRKRQRKDGGVKPSYKIDYLFPKGNAQDTSPNNPDGVDKELRGAQIEMRLAEIEEAFYVLGLMNNGKGHTVRRDNLRKANNVGSSSLGLDGIEWQEWRDRIDLRSVTMMGHSFGGATTVQALRSDRLSWITQGILLDPWGPATPECTEQKLIHKPVLSIGSEAFMHWADNFDCIEQVCKEAWAAGTLSWMTTIRGSTHLSQTDFAILYPNWMSLLMKTLVNPERAIYLTVRSALEFLKITLPATQTRFTDAWPDEQLLRSADSETSIVSDHRPDAKWVAARLKIPNEFSIRLRGMLKWNTSLASPAGLVSQSGEGEIWCHRSPEADSVNRYMRRND
ncbi:platelet-activating factor acetylhydrolase, isoform II-domain-containing protein [Corynascus similis CBS 632.67]